MAASSHENGNCFHQNVVVMRHGDRLDNFVPRWAASAPRPWDPPLYEEGRVRAFSTGRKLRRQLDFPIHRVFVSPFLRCLETAAEVVAALYQAPAKDSGCNDDGASPDDGVVVDPSKIKVSIEYGLSEMFNSIAIRKNVAPKDGIFTFDISQCEAVLPAGTIDNTREMLYKELPKWGETVECARARYLKVMKTLSDKYPSENLLLVTHGEAVGAVVSRLLPNLTVSEVEYCAYSLSRRTISFNKDQTLSAGEFVASPKGLVNILFAETSD